MAAKGPWAAMVFAMWFHPSGPEKPCRNANMKADFSACRTRPGDNREESSGFFEGDYGTLEKGRKTWCFPEGCLICVCQIHVDWGRFNNTAHGNYRNIY